VSDTEDETEIDRNDSDKIHNPEEAESVAFCIRGAEQARDVFQREEKSETPFGGQKEGSIGIVKAANAIQENGKDTDENHNKKDEVEEAARKGVVAKDTGRASARPENEKWMQVWRLASSKNGGDGDEGSWKIYRPAIVEAADAIEDFPHDFVRFLGRESRNDFLERSG